jgi:hypothetical protein
MEPAGAGQPESSTKKRVLRFSNRQTRVELTIQIPSQEKRLAPFRGTSSEFQPEKTRLLSCAKS